VENLLIDRVGQAGTRSSREKGDTEPGAMLRQSGLTEAGFATSSSHALDTAPPLLDEAELVKHAADDPVSKLRNSFSQIFHC
jgi:hypothetical protein